MKILNRIFYFIAVVIILGCLGVLICAMNPSLTQSLAQKLHGVGGGFGKDSLAVQTGEDVGIDWNKVSVGEGGYNTPNTEQIEIPMQIGDKAGFEQIKESAALVEAKEGEMLKNQLEMGNTGEELSFDSNKYPYYAMLTDSMKKLYKQIYANAMEQKSSFAPVVFVNTNQLKNVFEAVYNDHPELFWLETGYSCKYLRDNQCIEICLQYNQTVNNLEEAKINFEKNAEQIISGAKSLSGALDKEKYVHDQLTRKMIYNAGAQMNQSAYSALVGGESVCAGYARAFQYLMQQLDIPCYYCNGYSGEDHAWNIIKLDNAYYNVDVTWDDTIPATYDFFNKTDEEFSKTHIRKGLSVYLPACGNSPVGNGQDTEEENDTQSLINPNPQKPLVWVPTYEDAEEEKESEKEKNLKEAGITEAEVLETLDKYYADCLKQMVKAGAGMQQFTNVIPEKLWKDIEPIYLNEGYKEKYVDAALKQLGKENFAIQLQAQRLGGGYCRLYHNISTW